MTIEEYLEQYPEIEAMACMYFLWYNNMPLDEEDGAAILVIDHWKRTIEHMSSAFWKDGNHEGDCTHQASTCNRCMLEEMARDAYNFYLKLNSGTSIPAPPDTYPRNKST